jgi:hypothetical protein
MDEKQQKSSVARPKRKHGLPFQVVQITGTRGVDDEKVSFG